MSRRGLTEPALHWHSASFVLLAASLFIRSSAAILADPLWYTHRSPIPFVNTHDMPDGLAIGTLGHSMLLHPLYGTTPTAKMPKWDTYALPSPTTSHETPMITSLNYLNQNYPALVNLAHTPGLPQPQASMPLFPVAPPAKKPSDGTSSAIYAPGSTWGNNARMYGMPSPASGQVGYSSNWGYETMMLPHKDSVHDKFVSVRCIAGIGTC